MAEADVMPIEAMGEDYLARAGDQLRAARERQGIDRAELSIRTKINERHLAAIEDSDFAALPARIYAVGFARSYAGAVGLDAPAIAAQVRRELEQRDAPSNARPAYDLDIEDPAKIPSSRLAWVAAGLGLALVVAGGIFWRSYLVPAVDLPPVREDMVAATYDTASELTPAAMVSPTAESAAGLSVPIDPIAAVPGTETATAPPAKAPAGRAPEPATSDRQAPPSPVAERLEPLPPAAAPAAPAIAPTSAPAT